MKLIEALKILRNAPPPDAEELRVSLACGFMPVHLETFLAAHLRTLCPTHTVVVETGLYGDLTGNLGRLAQASVGAGAVAIEWTDLDPRLGLRGLGGWGPKDLPDILETAGARTVQLLDALGRAAGHVPLAVCLPTLPLPPVCHTAGWQAGAVELALHARVAAFAAQVGAAPNVRVVNPQRLDRLSPPGERLDVKSEIMSGLPYTASHADAVAELLARLIRTPAPRKGLITDLDDTLWRGILGEVGVEGVSWDLDHKSLVHGLYQQLLRSLADAGILLAVASRNNAELVDEAFGRDDILLPKDRLWPMEVHWGLKSESVARILRAWNIGADAVVFVDDSPMELAQVGAAHPGVECIQFPTRDAQAAYELLVRLRDLFGKERVSDEDAIRLASIRSAELVREGAEGAGASPDAFLEKAEAVVTLNYARLPADPRAFELVNKTNQFNLNGRRVAEAAWQARLADPAAFLLVVAYEDKFGPLGKIAAVSGRVADDGLPIADPPSRERRSRFGGGACRLPIAGGRHAPGSIGNRESGIGNPPRRLAVDTWVMSCRAFGRRIEHRCLEQLFARFGVAEIALDFQRTERNGPLQEFLAEFLGAAPEQPFTLSREAFADKCPPLFHTVKEQAGG